MEWGPRALGARSILANPCLPEMQAILNEKVKHREAFRPFAPAVCADDADTYFECDSPLPIPADFMLMVYPIRPEWRARLPAVTHVDGSGRLQTVRREANRLYYDLIKEFGRLATPMPVYAMLFLVITLSSIGLPLTNGFIGEFLVLSGAFQAKAIYGILATTGVIWSAGYMLWLYQRIFFGRMPGETAEAAGHGHAAPAPAAHSHTHDHGHDHQHGQESESQGHCGGSRDRGADVLPAPASLRRNPGLLLQQASARRGSCR